MRAMFPLSGGAALLMWLVTQASLVRPPAVPFARFDAAMLRQAPASVQPRTKTSTSGREFFASWGYNGDSYTTSDLHINQRSLDNDFTLVAVRARDSKSWTKLFSHSLFVPQYNLRAGMFFNDKWGVEVALDHMKWIVRQDQRVHITGTLNGAAVDREITLTPDVLRYQLNNGANPIFFNVIRRVQLTGEPGRTGHVSFLAKAGGGFAVPHTENVLFGEPNEKGFQFLHGWDVDGGVAVRLHMFRRLYAEFEEKAVYARYFGVNVDRGEARHSIKANEFTFNFGMTFK
jgi:hypothetical protein